MDCQLAAGRWSAEAVSQLPGEAAGGFVELNKGGRAQKNGLS